VWFVLVCGKYFFLDSSKSKVIRSFNTMKIISTNSAPAAIGPYSQAIEVDGLLFASGQIPLSSETGAMVSGGIKEQAEQVMRNIAAILAAAGSDFTKVVKTTCFLTSMDDFAAFNEVYSQYFTGKPARSCVAVSALPRGVLVEVEVIAKISS
jgi:2-iminobutanoate/2-iminopropanoate deaminase